MTAISNFLASAADIYSIILIIRILFSWLPPDTRHNRFYEFIYKITEPVLQPIRRRLPPLGGFDFSPIVVFLVLHIISVSLRNS